MRGITLIAVGGDGYLRWACNMACSVKYHSPNAVIQLIVSDKLSEGAEQFKGKLFDIITVVDDLQWTDNEGRIFPAKLKTQFYELVPFDEFIYLDVDGCILKDITPLFEQKANIVTDVQAVYDRSMGNEFKHMKWCRPDVVWSHYGLSESDLMPAINSSFMFVRKCEEMESLFAQAHYNLMINPIPKEKHWHTWGRVSRDKVNQPDELYINVAMAQLKIVPAHEVAIYFRMINDTGENLTADQIRKNHYGVGLFGQIQTNHRANRGIYDCEMKAMWTSYMGGSFNATHDVLSRSKFAEL